MKDAVYDNTVMIVFKLLASLQQYKHVLQSSQDLYNQGNIFEFGLNSSVVLNLINLISKLLSFWIISI